MVVPFQMPAPMVPTLVRLLLTTALPRLVASKTLVPAMRYSLALAMLTLVLRVLLPQPRYVARLLGRVAGLSRLRQNLMRMNKV